MTGAGRRRRQHGRAPGRMPTLVALVAWLTPALALGCPTCATREGWGLAGLALLGAMIALPFVVAAVTFRAIRKLERER